MVFLQYYSVKCAYWVKLSWQSAASTTDWASEAVGGWWRVVFGVIYTVTFFFFYSLIFLIIYGIYLSFSLFYDQQCTYYTDTHWWWLWIWVMFLKEPSSCIRIVRLAGTRPETAVLLLWPLYTPHHQHYVQSKISPQAFLHYFWRIIYIIEAAAFKPTSFYKRCYRNFLIFLVLHVWKRVFEPI